VKVRPGSAYLICTLPRSGSWLLAHGLRATGLAGRPEEYFWDQLRSAYAARWGLPPEVPQERFMRAALRAGSTPNGVFGAKLHWFELRQLVTRLGAARPSPARPARQLVDAAFARPRFVRLIRQDKVRQALSYHRALRTGEWWKPDRQRRTAGSEPPMDFQRVQALESMLAQHEAEWNRFFAHGGATPLVITYEELCENYGGVVRRVLKFIGAESGRPVRIGAPVLERQADAERDRLVHEYITMQRAAAS